MTASDNSPNPQEAEHQRLAEALALAQRDLQLLGFEIHDSVVQDLAAAAMLVEGAARQATFETAEAQQNFLGGLRLLQQGIAAARKLVQGTSLVEIDEQGLVPALRRLAEKFSVDHGLPVTLQCDVEIPSLPTSVAHLLLRIAQESLYNSWKHAQASEVEVRLHKREECLEMVIADNGIGFDPAKVPAGQFGLEGIRARAKILGASLVFDTAPNHGTNVVVQLPLSVV